MGPLVKTWFDSDQSLKKSLFLALALLFIQSVFDLSSVTAVLVKGCGERLYQHPAGRIVGGTATQFADFPWLGALFRENKTVGLYGYACGGSLLNNYWVLTAAHCLYNYTAAEVFWSFGEHDMSHTNEPLPYEDRLVDKIFIHPDYNPKNYQHDMAIAKLKTAMQKKDHISPICLPEDNNSHVGETAIVAGWGASVHKGKAEDLLRVVEVPIISISDCRKWYQKAGFRLTFTDFNICAGRESGGIDACQGDSGSPLMIHDTANNRFTVIGVTSWGKGCGDPHKPGVYEKVSMYTDWIDQTMAANP